MPQIHEGERKLKLRAMLENFAIEQGPYFEDVETTKLMKKIYKLFGENWS